MPKRPNTISKEICKPEETVLPKRKRIILTSDTHYGLNHKTHEIHEKFLTKLKKFIEENKVDALIHAGDWSCHKQNQFYRSMKMFRKYIDLPIICVRGNHDFWENIDKYKKTRYTHWGDMQNLHKKWFEEHNIHHLESGPYILDDVVICGFDGWYGNANPPTNDASRIIDNIEGCPSMVFHSSRAFRQLSDVLSVNTDTYRASICVSHFPPFGGDWKTGGNAHDLSFSANPKYLDPICDKFDVFCMGHSHERVDRVHNTCRLLNAGSDYNAPSFIMFEI